ncbi:MAG: DUF4271 domain-containing protein [Bacteroidetes bacterium]|nr:DUF4271 domain-containing protein [Bacteroidota bacterium]
MEGIERASYILGSSWMFIILLVCLAILAYVQQSYPARFNRLFRATFNERMTRQVMREEMVFSHRASLLLLLTSGIVTSVLIVVLWNYISQTEHGFSHFALVLAILITTFLLRQGIRMVLDFIIGRESGLREFNFVSSLVYKVLGMSLIPVVLCATLTRPDIALYFLGLAGLLITAFAIYRWYRGWKIGRYAGSGVYHLMIYLCTLEILPIFVLIKGVMVGSSI